MELRQLRCFVAIADDLHFGRAARRLEMSPASLGRQLAQLEAHLGAALVARTTRHVALTPAGQDFAQAARDILARARAAEARVRQTASPAARVLRLGAIDSAAAGLAPQLLADLRRDAPDIAVRLTEQKSVRLLPRLLSGALDLAFVRPPETRDPRLVFRALLTETPVVAMPASHPLAGRAVVGVRELADQPLIVPDRRTRPHSHDLTMRLFLQAGLTARIAQIADEKQTIVSLVASGIGLAVVPRWTARLAATGVRYVALRAPDGAAADRLALSVAWLRGVGDPLRDRVLELLDRRLPAYAATA